MLNEASYQLLKEMVLSRFDDRPVLLRELQAIFLEAEEAITETEVTLPELPDLSDQDVVLPLKLENLTQLRRLIDETFYSPHKGEANLYLVAFADKYFHHLLCSDDISLENNFSENRRQLIEHCQLRGELPMLWRWVMALRQLKNR